MLKSTLYEHQVKGVDYLVDHPRKAAMWGMPMATGKTITTLGAIERLDARVTFVGCPSSVVLGWSNEILKHVADPAEIIGVFAGKKLRILDGGVRQHLKNKPSGTDKARALRKYAAKATREGKRFIFVTNHEATNLTPLSETIRSLPLDLLVADEIHKLKSPTGDRSKWYHQTVRKMRRQNPNFYAVGLTGTIEPHSPMDVFGQYRLLDDALFGLSYFRFRNKFAVMGGYENKTVIGYINTKERQELMASMTYQVDKSVVDLPKERAFYSRVQLGDKGRKIYNALESSMCAELSSGDELLGTVSVDNPLGKLLRLQQVCSGYVPLDPDQPFDDAQLIRVDTAKEDCLDMRLEVVPEDEPIVAFTRFRPDLDTVAEVCKRHGRTCYELSGRKDQLEEWLEEGKEGGASMLAVQIQAGGVGVELQRASFAHYYSVGFNLGDYLQSRARLARPNSAKGYVDYEHSSADDTVDPATYGALEKRRALVDGDLKEVAARAEEIERMALSFRSDVERDIVARGGR